MKTTPFSPPVTVHQRISSPAATEIQNLSWAEAGSHWEKFFHQNPDVGFQFSWHDLGENDRFDCEVTSPAFQLILWLNLTGGAVLSQSGATFELPPDNSAVFAGKLGQNRLDELRHRFILVRFQKAFVLTHFAKCLGAMKPIILSSLRKNSSRRVTPILYPFTSSQRKVVRRLCNVPSERSSEGLWYLICALELMLAFLTDSEEPVIARSLSQHRSRERVSQVLQILKLSISSPPTLQELARQVGSSRFHLSRQFRTETGTTIPQVIQKLRLDRSIELLRSGECTVKEVAGAVGYQSVSHFTTIFQQTFGCLPSHFAMLTPGEAAKILSLHS